MPNLVPIKVKIEKGVGARGVFAKYPDFNLLSSSVREGLDWSVFLDARGIGWHYDSIANIGKGEDFEYGVTCVPKAFAQEAVTTFPLLVEVLTEAVFETFYNDRSHVSDSAIHRDTAELQSLAALETLGGLDPTDKAKALNPDDPTPGLSHNRNKTWADVKSDRKIVIEGL